MWLLPIDLSGVVVPLTEGRHDLPWYLSDHDVRRLTSLLSRVVPGVRYVVDLTAETLRRLRPEQLGSLPESLVVVRIAPADVAREGAAREIEGSLGRLPSRALIVRDPRPRETGYAWYETALKATVLAALRAHVVDERHPLASLNLRAVPIDLASSFSPDLLEVLDLLESALAHRCRYAAEGTSEDDYRRSLLLAVGRQLARRLVSLPAPELPAALEVVLARGLPHDDVERFWVGAAALERVGLARCADGRVELAPLATGALVEAQLWGALLTELPRAAWTDRARALLDRVRLPGSPISAGEARTVDASAPMSTGSTMDAAPLRAHVVAVLGQGSAQAALEAVALLQELMHLPDHEASLPAGPRRRVAGALRHLEALEPSASPDGARLLRLLAAALRQWSAIGKGSLVAEEEALAALEQLASKEHAPELDVLLRARLRHAQALVERPRSRADIDRAEQLCRASLSGQGSRAAVESRMLIQLGLIAHVSGDDDEARALFERALEISEVFTPDDRAGMALACHQIGMVAQDRGDYDEAREWYIRALELNEEFSTGAAADDTSDQLELDGVAPRRGDPNVAREWYVKSLDVGEVPDRRAGMAASLHQLGNVSYLQRDLDMAREWYLTSLVIDEELGNRAGMATTCHQLGMVAQDRGEHDAAREWYEKALDIDKKRENPAGMAPTLSQLGILATERGRPEEGVRFNVRALLIRLSLNEPRGGIDSHWLRRQRELVGDRKFRKALGRALGSDDEVQRILDLIEPAEKPGA
jgi:tetratricopeptide (TPR) repeat protein